MRGLRGKASSRFGTNPRPRAIALMLATALAGFAPHEAHGVVITTYLTLSRNALSTRVGSQGGTIDEVAFVVAGPGAHPNLSPPPIVQPDTVTVEVIVDKSLVPLMGNHVTISVNSQDGLQCMTPNTCGNTAIPFSNISWDSYDLDPLGRDIRSGSFTNEAAQLLSTVRIPAVTLLSVRTEIRNALRFRYTNRTLYPAGLYRGRVTYTAAVL